MGPFWGLPVWLAAIGMEAQPVIGLFWKQHSLHIGISLQPYISDTQPHLGRGHLGQEALESDPVIREANLVLEASSYLLQTHGLTGVTVQSHNRLETGNGALLYHQPSLQGLPSVVQPETSPFWKNGMVTERKMTLPPDIPTLHWVLNHLNYNIQQVL